MITAPAVARAITACLMLLLAVTLHVPEGKDPEALIPLRLLLTTTAFVLAWDSVFEAQDEGTMFTRCLTPVVLCAAFVFGYLYIPEAYYPRAAWAVIAVATFLWSIREGKLRNDQRPMIGSIAPAEGVLLAIMTTVAVAFAETVLVIPIPIMVGAFLSVAFGCAMTVMLEFDYRMKSLPTRRGHTECGIACASIVLFWGPRLSLIFVALISIATLVLAASAIDLTDKFVRRWKGRRRHD